MSYTMADSAQNPSQDLDAGTEYVREESVSTREVDSSGSASGSDTSVEKYNPPYDKHLWVESIKLSYDLWEGENSIKTSKLYVYILVQSILVTAYASGARPDGFLIPIFGIRVPLVSIFIPLVGIGSSYMTFVSIGRTVAFQKAWKRKRKKLVKNAPEPVRTLFDFYPNKEDKERYWYGTLGSKYVLLAPPAIGLVLWVVVLVGGAAIIVLT